MTTNAHRSKPRIAVLGGGFAGLESAFYLRAKLGPEARITLVTDRPEFLFKPNTIYIPFGAEPSSFYIPLRRPAARRDITLVTSGLDSVDLDRSTVRAGGADHPYDFLVIATGADMAKEEIDGLADHAETIWTPDEMSSLGVRLTDLAERADRGQSQTLLFVVPPNNKCAGPLYEIVFMAESWLRRRKVRDRVRIVYTTYEHAYIQAFGPKLHDVVKAEFAQRGIEGHTDYRLVSVDRETAYYEGGARERHDVLVAFPPYVAAVRYPGLPADGRGFLATEPATRQVVGHERVFAPGDAGDFPVKQAFLAFLQADAVAEAIVGRVTDRQPAHGFDPVSMCVMEEFDTATFAQVPLMVTGNPDSPVAVRPDADGSYRVGVSPAWRVGKKLLGFYLPFRFKAGLPFHSGLPWRAMDLGLKGMATLLARR